MTFRAPPGERGLKPKTPKRQRSPCLEPSNPRRSYSRIAPACRFENAIKRRLAKATDATVVPRHTLRGPVTYTLLGLGPKFRVSLMDFNNEPNIKQGVSATTHRVPGTGVYKGFVEEFMTGPQDSGLGYNLTITSN